MLTASLNLTTTTAAVTTTTSTVTTTTATTSTNNYTKYFATPQPNRFINSNEPSYIEDNTPKIDFSVRPAIGF